MKITRHKAEEMIFDFLGRVSVVMMEDYKDQQDYNLKIDHFKLIKYKIVSTKMGNVKEITWEEDIPFRTRFFFNNNFTDLLRAYQYFSPFNREANLKHFREHFMSSIGQNKLIVQEWARDGLIAHRDAIANNYQTPKETNKRDM